MPEKKRIPEIRFDGFEEEWEEKRLGEMATFSKGNGYSKDDLTDNGSEIMLYGTMYTDYKTEIYSTNQFVDEKNNSIKSEGTEVVIPSSGETAIDIARASSIKSKGIILGGDLNIVYPDENLDNTFLALSLTYGKRKKELIKRAQGASIIHIKNDDIKQSKIIYPNISEQNKISNLISNIDNIIENISKEIKKVRDYKKSMLQKMFPKQGEKVPEIRFEGFEGEWRSYTIKELLNYEQPTKYIVESDDYINAGIPVLTANKAFILGYTNENREYNKGNCIIFDDFTMDFKYVDFNFMVKSSALKILTNTEKSD